MSGIILLIVVIVLIVLIAYLIGVMTRKKNDGRLAALEERKDALLALPIAEEIEAIDHLHLVGQSQDGFETLRSQWQELTATTFPRLTENLEEAELLNDTFRFLKVKQILADLDEELTLTGQEVADLHAGLSTLREQEDKNSSRVKYALDLYEELDNHLVTLSPQLGLAVPEIQRQLLTIQEEFSQFVALNSSGDPLEAAHTLERAEEHTIALGQISEQIPDHVQQLEHQLPDKLEDLETGYAQLLEDGYHFGDYPIEKRFQTVREALSASKADLAGLELDKVEAGVADIEERLSDLYDFFEKEIAAHKKVKKSIRLIPSYLEHAKANHSKLNDEILRLSQTYILDEAQIGAMKSLSRDLDKIETEVLPGLTDGDLPEQPFTILETVYGNTVKTLEQVEKEQLALVDVLKQVEKDEAAARRFLDKIVNHLHVIKRFMEKRRLPGIPQEFLTIFFSTSSQVESLMTELDRNRVDIKTVNELVTSTEKAVLKLEETTYSVVQYATLTEQLLQYSNRYRSFDHGVQSSFDLALELFEINHDYRGAFDEISYALELVEPGVTERFVTSYEKTREIIRF